MIYPVRMVDFLILLAVIPIVTGVIGWFTNYVAVKMIFEPRHFRGIGPLGWQGILPRNATRFAGGVADTITEHLISPREMAERLDPVEMEEQLISILEAELPEICRRAANAMREGAWDTLPEPMKAAVITQIESECREAVETLFDELTGLSNEILPLRPLIEEQLSGRNVGNLVRLFRGAGKEEFKFIEVYGGVFGFLIGLVQVALWSFLQQWWLMPVIGVIVGLATNWLAIQMIFRPLEPTRFLGVITYQGMFPRRQAQISAEYGRIVSHDVLSIRNLFRLLTQGEVGARIATVVSDVLESRIDNRIDNLGKMLTTDAGDALRSRVKEAIIERVLEQAPTHQPEVESLLERRLDIANTLETRLAQLPKSTFERVLRGVFEEDELTLIFCGGFLGGLVGAAQAAVLVAM